MRPAAALAIVALLSGGHAAMAKPKARRTPPAASAPTPTPELHAAVTRGPDGWRADPELDGPLLGWALTRGPDGLRTLHVLVGSKRGDAPPDSAAPCAGPDAAGGAKRDARLYRWSVDAPDRLVAEGSDLPSGSLESADLDGNGEDELLLVRDGAIDLVSRSADGAATLRALAADASFGKSCCGPRLAWDDAASQDPVVRLEFPGAFRTYRALAHGGLAVVSEQAIPKRVAAAGERMSVSSPPVRAIGKSASGRMLFATEPEAAGKRRLRTSLLDPDAPRESQTLESWALFPGAERVVDTSFSFLGGDPVLVVTTTSGDKLSLLGEKGLRVFPLSGDRTRAGDAPLFAATTGINLWQEANPSVVDLDRDGRDDLVLAYWKGLKNAIAALEVYRGGAAPVLSKGRSMSIDVEGGAKGFIAFGPDLDGDGRPDLTLLAKGELVVFPGTAPEKAVDRPVDTKPSRRVAVPAGLPTAQRSSFSMGTGGFEISRSAGGLGTPHFLDLDGDVRPELIFAGDAAAGVGRVVVVFVRGGTSVAPSSTISRGMVTPG